MPRLLTYNVHRCVGGDRRLDVDRIAAVMEERGIRMLDAPVSGCWYPKKQPGDRLKTGELLGEIRSIYGETLFRISAEADCVLLYQTASLGIKAGTPMIAYAEVEKEVSQ